MKNTLSILTLLLVTSCSIFCQEIINNCIRIDFETINGETPVSGLRISDQFKNTAGISFVLENGENPVIANVGLPTEAFFSSNGPDNIANSASIGDFMLTDDGVVDGVGYSPLEVIFENPIDSISGVILDIDSDEKFIIFAINENNVVVHSQTIESGDPQTGDGIGTPWGFNLSGCEGKIHKIKFEGSRSDGDFGLGMDNFVFCFSGVDLLQDLEVDVTDIYCQGNPGAIQLSSPSNDMLIYSIDDGLNFNSDGFFNDLITGNYEIVVSNSNGCSATLNVEVEAQGPTIIEDLIVEHTSCGLDNGSFQVIATQDSGVNYYIDAFNIVAQNTFTNLEAGPYIITVIGPTGCSASREVIINPSEDLFLDQPLLMDDACQKTIGSIEITSTGGTGALSYSMDGVGFQTEALFDSLSMGEYYVTVQDAAFCTRLDTMSIGETPGITINQVQTTETLCDIPIGTIAISASGGTGTLNYGLENEEFTSQGYFEFLEEGAYNIVVRDELGCTTDSLTRIDSPVCPVFIPNIFTPDINDQNNEFKIYNHHEQDVKVISYQLYDRWGQRIYGAYDFGINDNGYWWNGNDEGYEYSSGVYIYRIELEYFDGTQQILIGDVTLTR